MIPQARLLDAFKPRGRFHHLCRVQTVMGVVHGLTEAEIYRKVTDTAIRSAREEGCDEPNVEVVAAQARRYVACSLDECRATGIPIGPGG